MFKLKKFSLHLFDGAASGASGGTDGGAVSAEGAAAEGNETGGKVIYGKQPETKNPVAEDKKENSADDARKRYEQAIKGEFKEFDAERIQNIIDRRFKETKELEEKIGAMENVLASLYEKYKVEGGNLQALQNAIDTDDAFWEQGAEEAGMSIEAFKEFRKIKADHDNMMRTQAQNKRIEEARERLHKWHDEAEELKGIYEGFDLDEETKNPEFQKMLRAGIPMKHAYEVLHLNDITSAKAAEAAKIREKQVVDNIRAKGARPQEGGATAQSGAIIKSDVSTLTKRDRAEIAKRVSRGEKISF